jgi:hypothetical protein
MSLRDAARLPETPPVADVYRIRRIGFDGLDYVGQTGKGSMTLRKRLAMLVGVYGAQMPYRDPHTAAPALWALRQGTKCDFEVSVAAVDGSLQERLAIEAVLIALYRQERQRSPTVNFGRTPGRVRVLWVLPTP